MRTLPSRQVHLDFHTSPLIPGVGARFDKQQFQAALKEGNVNSITLFAKCHHGLCYYPTRVGTVHPTLPEGFDLTGAMMDAAHEIGVDAPVYITMGWSALDAEQHPEWCARDEQGNFMHTNIDPGAKPEDPRPNCSWTALCPNTGYGRHVLDLAQEVADRYPRLDGLFFDIVYLQTACYCPDCIAGMKAEGLDPSRREDAEEYYRRVHLRFAEDCRKILHAKHPQATLFFNSGGAEIYRPEYHGSQTHFEMEDLPTAWGGYDKMPPRASVMSRYPKEYLGMTGKFHTEWGEFGGYKNPDALTYEVLMMAMYGAKCSIGDQMPPNGRMDMETYRIIGQAYRRLEQIEPWAYPAQPTATLGVYLSGCAASDEGLHSMLLESHIDFEVVLPGDDLSRFDALALPDCVKLSDEEAQRIRDFDGAVIFSAESAVKDGAFQLDAGVRYAGRPHYRQDYCCPGEQVRLPFGNAPFLCYEAAQRTEAADGEVLAQVWEPWFDRTYAAYCSHRNTPYRNEPAAHPAVVRKARHVYLAHPLCRMYHEMGAQVFRELFIAVLRLVYRPQYRAAMPSAGRTRLTRQSGRYVFHAAYASPVRRGRISVLEDMVPLHDVQVEIRLMQNVTAVRLAPQGQPIPFDVSQGTLRFVIPCVQCHQAVEILTEEM